MKLVTQTSVSAGRFTDAGAVKRICEAGFDGIDYSLFYLKRDDCPLMTPAYEKHCRKLLDIAGSYGVTFEQAHAPFPMYYPFRPQYHQKMMDTARRALEICSVMGIKACVIHPSGEFWFHRHGGNIEMFNELLPTAKQCGVKIAIENMYGWFAPLRKNKKSRNICSTPEDFNYILDHLDPDWFTGCLDLGHCGLVRVDAADMIYKMGGKRITALHVHDNNFVDDTHTLPYQQKMDWPRILKALADINYSGEFTFEADSFLRKLPDELFPSALKFMHDTGRYMINEIEKYKSEEVTK